MSDNEVEAPNNAATQAIATGHGVTDIAAVALKLPFWSADPQVWFAQVESQFFTRKITNQDTKFHHIVACLPPEVAVDIRDLIINKPPDNAYDELINTLIKRTTASHTKRLQQLLSAEELGDRKPSQLLHRFEQLLDGTSSDHPLIREVFLQRLPINVRQLLTVTMTDETPLDELALRKLIGSWTCHPTTSPPFSMTPITLRRYMPSSTTSKKRWQLLQNVKTNLQQRNHKKKPTTTHLIYAGITAALGIRHTNVHARETRRSASSDGDHADQC